MPQYSRCALCVPDKGNLPSNGEGVRASFVLESRNLQVEGPPGFSIKHRLGRHTTPPPVLGSFA